MNFVLTFVYQIGFMVDSNYCCRGEFGPIRLRVNVTGW